MDEFDQNGMSLYSGTYPRSNGGTEQQFRKLMAHMSDNQKNHYQIICSRVRKLYPNKRPILWLHDHVTDPETVRLADQTFVSQFEKLVFVSNTQYLTYRYRYGISHDRAVVIPNMVEPFEAFSKPDISPLRLIYHTTPHRGLSFVPAILDRLDERGINYHMDIFSSFSIYGWDRRDVEYEPLFDNLKSNPNVTYHGAQPNDVVRDYLKDAHIFLYPCVFPETSCIAAIEAQMAGCLVVCPEYEALIETVWPSLSNKFEYTVNQNKFLDNVDKALMSAIERLSSRPIDNSDYIKHYSSKRILGLWDKVLV